MFMWPIIWHDCFRSKTKIKKVSNLIDDSFCNKTHFLEQK